MNGVATIGPAELGYFSQGVSVSHSLPLKNNIRSSLLSKVVYFRNITFVNKIGLV